MVFVRRVHIFQSTRPSRGATTAFGHSSICRPSFQSTRPSRGATGDFSTIEDLLQFQSTRPSRGATQTGRLHKCPDNNFNPRAPRGARRWSFRCKISLSRFQSTRPSRGATQRPVIDLTVRCKISIHAPLAGRDQGCPCLHRRSEISIHAPLAGRDRLLVPSTRYQQDFNPRAPRGARPATGKSSSPRILFQSTRPSRGATSSLCGGYVQSSYFNPRAPRGARRTSIWISGCGGRFQSTRPSRGATTQKPLSIVVLRISIHAPLAGRDWEAL